MPIFIVEVDNDGFKVYDSAGNLIDPAKDSSAQSILSSINSIKDTAGIKKITDPLPAGTNVIGAINQGSAGASLWKVDGSGATQPISAASLPLPAGAATETTLSAIKDTAGIKKITDALPTGDNIIGRAKITDGANALAITSGSVAKVAEYDSVASPVGLAVVHDTLIPDGTKGKLFAGRDDANRAQFIRTTAYGEIITSGSEVNITGYGETRVASPYLIGNYVNKYQLDSYWYETDIAGGGTVVHIPLQSAVRLSVGAASGDKARLRTNNYFRYQAGRSMLVRISGYCSDSGQVNQTRRWGYFDDSNGLFFEQSNGTLYVVRRTSVSGSVVDNKVAQANWNTDVMDGTGASGVTLDYTKGNIWEMTFQWLGVGLASMFINSTLVHQFRNPNSYASPYMQTAVLPLSWEVINDGAAAAGSYTFICGAVLVEGGLDLPEYTFGVYNPTDVTIGTTEVPILSIRPALTFNSIANRMVMVPIFATVSTDGARASYRLVLNGTLTGASWTSVDASSVGEYDTTATVLSGGITLVRGMLPNAVDSRELEIFKIFNAFSRSLRRKAFSSAVDTLTIMCKNEKNTGGTTLMRASLTWQEVR